jgi:hypothetical protein
MHIARAARRQARILGIRRLAASLGLIRGFSAIVAREAPPEYARADRAILLSARQRRASVRELLMAAQMRGEPSRRGSIPLTVLTRPRRPGAEPAVWAQLQDLQLDEPDLVIGAIRELVRRCRH